MLVSACLRVSHFWCQIASAFNDLKNVPTETARPLTGKRVDVCDYPDGRLEIRHGEHVLRAVCPANHCLANKP